MPESKLTIEVRGVQGREPKCAKNIGSVFSTIDNPLDFICIDAFQGYGDTYARRTNSIIEIVKDGNQVFYGTFEELCKKLKSQENGTL